MSKKVLLIDDDELMLEMVKFAVSKSNEEIELLWENAVPEHYIQCDLVISDLKLGNSSGEATLKNVRDVFPDSKLIIMSGVEPTDINELKTNFNASDFLEKDNILTHLISLIVKLISD